MTTTVLIIDDDKGLCALLADFLKLESFVRPGASTMVRRDEAGTAQETRGRPAAGFQIFSISAFPNSGR